MTSLPSWERGLKYKLHNNRQSIYGVAPLVGAWIEMPHNDFLFLGQHRRSPRGSVD